VQWDRLNADLVKHICTTLRTDRTTWCHNTEWHNLSTPCHQMSQTNPYHTFVMDKTYRKEKPKILKYSRSHQHPVMAMDK